MWISNDRRGTTNTSKIHERTYPTGIQIQKNSVSVPSIRVGISRICRTKRITGILDDVLYASDGGNQAVGIVTESVVYETEEEEKSTLRWAIADSLMPLREWIEDIDELKSGHETHQ